MSVFLSFINVYVCRPEKNTLMPYIEEICILLKVFLSWTFPKSLLRGAGWGRKDNFFK